MHYSSNMAQIVRWVFVQPLCTDNRFKLWNPVSEACWNHGAILEVPRRQSKQQILGVPGEIEQNTRTGIAEIYQSHQWGPLGILCVAKFGRLYRHFALIWGHVPTISTLSPPQN